MCKIYKMKKSFFEINIKKLNKYMKKKLKKVKK